jgi:hypothetical protein
VRLASLLAMAAAIAPVAGAQTTLGVALDGLDGAAIFNALAQECYEAGLWSSMPSDSIMDCAEPVEEPAPAQAADAVLAPAVVRHKLRFTLIERAGAGRIGAEAWTETEELGTVIEEPVTSQVYLQRVQGVLTAVVARLRERGAPPWTGRYANEQAWHLAAHLEAVSHCDANLAGMTAGSVAAQLESVGLRALDDDTRDRCEQLFTHLYEWGLVRGDADPTVQAYLRYRSSLPAEQRTCSGQLARDAACRR